MYICRHRHRNLGLCCLLAIGGKDEIASRAFQICCIIGCDAIQSQAILATQQAIVLIGRIQMRQTIGSYKCITTHLCWLRGC